MLIITIMAGGGLLGITTKEVSGLRGIGQELITGDRICK
jgi:hypothetical protein